LLVKWLTAEDWPPWWSSLTLMFQKEVAQRVVAHVGDDAYGRLSVLARWRTEARILFDVSRSAFVPPPNVTSSVLQLEPLFGPRYPADLHDLEKVTAAAFGQRRKMLRGSLRTLFPDPMALLDAAGIAGTLRAEALDLEQFCALARAYGHLRSRAAVP
jgi:16S rRNA (adenine1518-N6/adenine1519-N6)-dimethyltransferase